MVTSTFRIIGIVSRVENEQDSSSTWLDISGGAVDFTAPGQGGFVLPAGPIRAAVTGGTPSGLEAVAAQV